MNFDTAIDSDESQCLPNSRMLDFIDCVAVFDFRINHADSMFKKGGQIPAGQITVFVDCAREHRAAMLAIPHGIIRSASKKRDPVRSSGDDHRISILP
jgi:hypothetical protein